MSESLATHPAESPIPDAEMRVQNNSRETRSPFKRSMRHGWQPGQSGNPGGRPARTFSIRGLVGLALARRLPGRDRRITEQVAIDRFAESLRDKRSVLAGLEFAARVNREVGLGSDQQAPSGITVIINTGNAAGLRPEALRGALAPIEAPPIVEHPPALASSQAPAKPRRKRKGTSPS